jgi:hypothetical protein
MDDCEEENKAFRIVGTKVVIEEKMVQKGGSYRQCGEGRARGRSRG